MSHNLMYGNILFPLFVLVTILWDLKRGFRGIVLQILGALCAGTVVNAAVNGDARAFFLYVILSVVFYSWAWRRRTKAANGEPHDSNGKQ